MPLFRKLRLLTLEDLFHFSCCRLYQKLGKCIHHPYFTEQLQTNSSVQSHITRQINNIHCLNTRTSIERQSLYYKISNSWNNLPPQVKVKSDRSQHSFAKYMKKHFISCCLTNCTIIDCYICNR
jgi:hypothetical protein